MTLHGINYLGVGLAAIGITWLAVSVRFSLSATRTKGTILKYLRRDDESADGPTFSPVFEYQDQEGMAHTVATKWGTHPVLYKPGQQVDVLYSKQSPHRAKIHNPWFFYWIPIGMLLAGCYFIQTQ